MAFDDAPIPLRAINEYAYCPRLFHFMYVEGIFVSNADVDEGSEAHERAAVRSDRIRRKSKEEIVPHQSTGDDTESIWPVVPKNLKFGNGKNLVGVLDAIEIAQGKLIPVEAKKSASPESGPIFWQQYELPAIAWYNDQLQILAQIKLLRENGYVCDEGIIYYRENHRRVHVPFDERGEKALEAIIAAIIAHDTQKRPMPLLHSRKCIRCSLNSICLPDETNALNGVETESLSRRVLTARDDRGAIYVLEHNCQIGIDGEQLKIRSTATQKISLRDVVGICILSNAQISTQALKTCFQNDIRVAFFSTGGRLQGIAAGFAGKNLELRRLQFTRFPEISLFLSRKLIAAKIANQKTIIRRNHDHPQIEAYLKNFQELIDKTESAEHLDAIRGYEGAAARLYFQLLSQMFVQRAGEFDFQGRNRRPPKDPINALLSLAYTLLLNDCAGAIIAVGLEPGFGFFHRNEPGRPSLALDLMEAYRPIIADSAVLRVINTKMVGPNDFVITPAGCIMKKSAKKALIESYERRMNQLVRHPQFDYHLSYRRVLEADVRLLGRFLEGEVKKWQPMRVR